MSGRRSCTTRASSGPLSRAYGRRDQVKGFQGSDWQSRPRSPGAWLPVRSQRGSLETKSVPAPGRVQLANARSLALQLSRAESHRATAKLRSADQAIGRPKPERRPLTTPRGTGDKPTPG